MPRLELKRLVLVALATATVLGIFPALVVSAVLGRVFRLPADAELLDIAPLAPGDYAVEVKLGDATRTTAFRVVP